MFRGAVHDVALLFAAQGGTAVHNTSLYGAGRPMVYSLHAEAFRLSRYSRNTNQRVPTISAQLMQGRLPASDFRPPSGQ